MENLTHAPASYHWTPKLQRDFLEHVSTTGSVTISAARAAVETARRAFFGLPVPANDTEKEEERDISRKDAKAQRGSASPRRQAP